MITAENLVSESVKKWRESARFCLHTNLRPDIVSWDPDGSASLMFGQRIDTHELPQRKFSVPRQFVRLADTIGCHRDGERWSMLYTLLWRLTHGESHLLQVTSDPVVSRLIGMHRSVRRAAHKMKAFVRFRAIDTDAGEEFVAWFEPVHNVVEKTAPFFVDRFRSMRWSILTPDACARWDGTTLTISAGIERAAAPSSVDALEEYWRTYYAGIFNPARLNRAAMRAEMPKRYWKNLPEAILIDELSRNASARVVEMFDRSQSQPALIPKELDVSGVEHIAWDEVHDPGWKEARRRAEAVLHDASNGFLRGDTRIIAGVAGWTDPTLLAAGVFYPDDATTSEERLRFYASKLPMVEVDSTYYSLPSAKTAGGWVKRTPPNFLFNIKAHSLMTGHPTDPAKLPPWLKEQLPLRLRVGASVYAHHFSSEVIDEVWKRFLSALEPLRAGGKLGAIMLQYPRWFTPLRKSAAELTLARRRLGDWPATVEFRHRDWLSERLAPRTFGLLESLGLSYVIVDAPQGMESSVPPVARVTNPALAMFRFHGRRAATWEIRNEEVAERYRYLYDRAELKAWSSIIERTIDQAMNVHLTFNNNKWNYAIANALEMTEALIQ